MASESGRRVGQRIRELRLQARLSQAQLAEKLGPEVAVETVSRFERGVKVPTIEWIERITAVLGQDLQGFFAGLGAEPVERPADADLRRIVDLLTPLPAAHLRCVYRMLRAHLDAMEVQIPDDGARAAPRGGAP